MRLVIYEEKSPSETFYVLKHGRVALEAFYEIEHTNQIPVGLKKWEVQKTVHLIRRGLIVLTAPAIFGLEEMLLEYPKRKI